MKLSLKFHSCAKYHDFEPLSVKKVNFNTQMFLSATFNFSK